MIVRKNKIWIKMQEAEHSTTSGIIVDSKSDKFVDYGIVIQEQECYEETNKDVTYIIPEGARISYSKGMVTPLSEDEGIVDFKNVIGWEM